MIRTVDARLAGQRSRADWSVWAQRVLLVAALALMIGHLLVYIVYGVSLAAFPFDYDQGEGFELNDTVYLSQGQWPYRNNEVFPFYASNYPPLYHVFLVPFVWLFGPAYWYGRLFGFAAALVAAAAIAVAVHRETRHRPVAALAGLAFVASNTVYHIGPLFRQHMTMVMFETLAVVVVATVASSTEGKRQGRRIALALALLLAAGFTKQLAIATCGAVFVWLALRGVRRAIVWAVGFAAVAGGIFFWINLSTEGQWWLNIITANVNQYILGQFTGLLQQFVGLHGALLALAAGWFVYELYFSRLSVYSVWFAASLASSALAGKWGAGDSYFATAIAAMCVLAGLAVGRLVRARADGRLRQLAGLGGLALFVLYGLAVIKVPLNGAIVGPLAGALGLQSNTKFAHFYDSAGWTMGYATIGQIPTDEDVANGWRIVDAIDDDPRPILSEEAAFSFLSGKPVVTNPTQLKNLYENNAFDPAALVAAIEGQEFGAVIFRAGFFPQPVLAAVERAYEPALMIPMNGYEYTILYPDPEWSPNRTRTEEIEPQ